MPSTDPKHLAIIGGGRWARVLAGVLCKITPSKTKLTLCSPSNSQKWMDWIDSQSELLSERSVSVSTFEEILENESIKQVFIARAARDHAATAITVLNARKDVFVEKPFALSKAEAADVCHASQSNSCSTGLVFLFANNLRHFAKAAMSIEPLDKITIHWDDPELETRYSEHKNHDVGLNCCQDVFPHIWSLLRIINSSEPIFVKGVEVKQGGSHIIADLKMAKANISIKISRGAKLRNREIQLSGKNGVATINFSSEPGEATLNGMPFDVSENFSSPLARELSAILDKTTDSTAVSLCKVENASESIVISDTLHSLIRNEQLNQIEIGLKQNANREERLAADFALREIIFEKLGAEKTTLETNKGVEVPNHDSWLNIKDWLLGNTQNTNIPDFILSDIDFLKIKRCLK